MTDHRCEPHWEDPAGALRELADAAPPGLRPLMLQAAATIDAERAASANFCHQLADLRIQHDILTREVERLRELLEVPP